MKVINLLTEYKINPLGIETLSPRLSWEIAADGRGVVQNAYELKCANSLKDLESNKNLIWHSGKMDSEQSIQIEYKGNQLKSEERVYWQVKVWDNKGEVSKWSDAGYWEMGLLDNLDWKAQWIEPALKEEASKSAPCAHLRNDFAAGSRIQKASLYITCKGLYELSLNGEKVGDELFTPGWTSYHNRIQYQVFDVTERLLIGQNSIGVILADGWYRGYFGWQGKKNLYGDKLALLLQLKIFYDDGSEELVLSDDTWKSGTGPILESDIYNGEIYNARLEMDGWNCSGFDDSTWNSVIIRNFGYDMLVPSEGVPVKITETITPIEKIITPKGELVFDLGQNIVGWVQISLAGKAGSRITIQHAEVLDQEGNFYIENLRSAKAEDTYFFKADGVEVYEPHFTFHGFRYIKISEYEGEISLDNIRGRVIHSDMGERGDFECSDSLVNKLQKNIQWGLRGNFLDIPTDCPQRDERMGWTGDAQVFASTACFNRDTASFFSKWLKDLSLDQKKDGSVPWVVPNVVENGGGTGWSDGFGATGWADAAVVIPWTVYQVYDDKRILSEQYASMKAWEEYMIRESGDSCIFNSGFHFGDWLSFAEYYSLKYNAPDYGYAGAYTEKELIATAYYYSTTKLMHKIALVLGKQKDADRFSLLLPQIKTAFQREFLTQTGRLTSNTQTAYVLALSFGLIPDEMTAIAAKRLVDDINYFGHLTCGFLGTPLICQALTDSGYPEIAYDLLFNKHYPSWLYPITQGATTIWERWDGIKTDGTFQDVGMNSFNHYAYGAVGNWLYTSVAGINTDASKPGYKRIIIKPHLTNRLSYAKATYQSAYGRISSHWERSSEEIELNLEIPANTTARVHLPCSVSDEIYESDQKIDAIEEIVIIDNKNKRTVVEIGSGKYCFRFPL